MNDCRGRKCGSGLRRTKWGPLGNERYNDELQSNQGTCGRADDYVKAVPFCQLGHVVASSSVAFAPGKGQDCFPPALDQPWNCSSLTCSIQSTALPSSCS